MTCLARSPTWMKAKLTNFTKEVKSAMTKGKDREHFEDYREQTQIKHSILAAYLPAYYHILKGSNDNLIYIDGFAGPVLTSKQVPVTRSMARRSTDMPTSKLKY